MRRALSRSTQNIRYVDLTRLTLLSAAANVNVEKLPQSNAISALTSPWPDHGRLWRAAAATERGSSTIQMDRRRHRSCAVEAHTSMMRRWRFEEHGYALMPLMMQWEATAPHACKVQVVTVYMYSQLSWLYCFFCKRLGLDTLDFWSKQETFFDASLLLPETGPAILSDEPLTQAVSPTGDSVCALRLGCLWTCGPRPRTASRAIRIPRATFSGGARDCRHARLPIDYSAKRCVEA